MAHKSYDDVADYNAAKTFLNKELAKKEKGKPFDEDIYEVLRLLHQTQYGIPAKVDLHRILARKGLVEY